MRTSRMGTIFKRITAAALVATLAACGSGLSSMSSAGTGGSSSSSGGGASNNTPPGIPNSIVFVPPTGGNNVIALQGTGGNTNAQVTFQVDDASSTGVAGISVQFSLIPATGSATLTTTTGTTGANGQVSTFVVSGNVHETVTVQAQITLPSGAKTTANSNALTISTGIPTQGNFGIAISNLTANNADDTLGVTDTVTVQLSDRFNNPAPDGTAVSFQANIGQMQAECFTSGGHCTAVWTSSGLPAIGGTYQEQGQAEIFAYTVGEESFTDVDGDGVFDNSDIFTTGGTDNFSVGGGNPTSNDIGEVYLDGAGSGNYVSGDRFFDFNKDGSRNGPDGKFYGFGCKGTTTVNCGSRTTLGIGRQICVLMSTSGARIVPSTTSVSMGAGPSLQTVSFSVSDLNGHALASGTNVTILSAGLSSNITVNAPTNLPFSYPDVGCGADTRTFVVTITESAPAVPAVTPTGTLQLKVVTPGTGGAETDSAVVNIGP